MFWQTNKLRRIIFFILAFFLSYILIFFLMYAAFPAIQKNILWPILKTELAFLDPTSRLCSLSPEQSHVLGNIHYEIELTRHPGGNPSATTGKLVLRAEFSLRDNVLMFCLMLALSLSWPGLRFSKRLQALCIVLFSWLCLFSLLIPFALLNDDIPPVGFRLTMIYWWNMFLTHRGIAILTLLFFAGNTYIIYSLGQKSQANNATPPAPGTNNQSRAEDK